MQNSSKFFFRFSRHGWIELVKLSKNISVVIFFFNIFDEKMKVFFNSPFFEKIPKTSIYFLCFLNLWKFFHSVEIMKIIYSDSPCKTASIAPIFDIPS